MMREGKEFVCFTLSPGKRTKHFTKLLAKQKLSEMFSEMFSRFARALWRLH